MPNIIFNIPLYFTGITTYIYTELAPKLTATASVAQSVECWSRDSIPSRRPWSCIFRNWSRLGLKMYIFLTLEFTLLQKTIYTCMYKHGFSVLQLPYPRASSGGLIRGQPGRCPRAMLKYGTQKK